MAIRTDLIPDKKDHTSFSLLPCSSVTTVFYHLYHWLHCFYTLYIQGAITVDNRETCLVSFKRKLVSIAIFEGEVCIGVDLALWNFK